jgi:hypothetical protein
LVALLVAAPVVVSCSESPTAASLEPQVGFALSNPPPPPVGGISYGFTPGGTFLAAPLAASPLGAPVMGAAPQSQGCSADDGVCLPADFFQNAGGTNVWMNFTNTGVKLPKDIQKLLGASQSPGRIQYANGNTTGQGFAWNYAFGALWVLDLSQFTGPGNIFDVQREENGDFKCTALGPEQGSITIMKFPNGAPPAQVVPFNFFQFATQDAVIESENAERLCFPLEDEETTTY